MVKEEKEYLVKKTLLYIKLHAIAINLLHESYKCFLNGLFKYAQHTEYTVKEYINEGMLVGL